LKSPPGRPVFAFCFIAASAILPLTQVHPATYYISTTGSDSQPGTIDQPFLTLAKAVGLSTAIFSPGDTILVRGGVYSSPATVTISKNGTTTARYHLLAYPGERPLLDCSWLAPFAEVTAADFVSIDTAGVGGPRKADGSLPDITYLVPAPSSQFVDAGTDVGLLFNGSAPDLGAFETQAPAGLASHGIPKAGGFSLLPTYPNPFNGATTIAYMLPARREITVTIFDTRGTRVRTLFRAVQDAGFHSLRWDATTDALRPAASGAYIARIQAGQEVRSARLVLLK